MRTDSWKRDLGIGVAAFLIVVAVAAILLPTISWLQVALAVPILCVVFGFLRALHLFDTLDELERRIHAEAIVFAFAGTALITFSAGLLQNIGLPQLDVLFIWPLMATLWLIGLLRARSKYA